MTFYNTGNNFISDDKIKIITKTTTIKCNNITQESIICYLPNSYSAMTMSVRTTSNSNIKIFYSPDGENFDTKESISEVLNNNEQYTIVIPNFFSYIKIEIIASESANVSVTLKPM